MSKLTLLHGPRSATFPFAAQLKLHDTHALCHDFEEPLLTAALEVLYQGSEPIKWPGFDIDDPSFFSTIIPFSNDTTLSDYLDRHRVWLRQTLGQSILGRMWLPRQPDFIRHAIIRDLDSHHDVEVLLPAYGPNNITIINLDRSRIPPSTYNIRKYYITETDPKAQLNEYLKLLNPASATS